LANKVSIVRTNIPKHPGHALTFPPWQTFLSWFLPSHKHFASFCIRPLLSSLFLIYTEELYSHILNLSSFWYCFPLQILYFILSSSEVQHLYCKES
jgi:hypothetical protein